jgi:hypothetical protein
VIGDGVNTFTATSGSTVVDVTTWDLASLTVTPTTHSDLDFALTVVATATESENGDTATRTGTLNVVVEAVADQPLLTVPAIVTVDEDGTTSAFAINAALVDADGSESLDIVLSDIAEAVTITDGTNTFTGTATNSSVDVTGWNLSNLTVTPPADSDVDFRITVAATATETANADVATKIDLIDVQVAAVADQPTLTVPSTIAVDEDTQSAVFAITSAVTDVDGSESLKLVVSDVPVGTLLTDGPNSFLAAPGFNSVDISSWDLSNLTVTPPADSDQDFTLTVTATSREAENGDEATRSDTIDVEVTAVVDTPNLTVPATVTVDEDTDSADFTITSSLVDADGSETLLLQINDVPVGATLTDGTQTFTGSTGNTTVDVTDWNLTSLSITPPTNSDVDFTLTVVATATESANLDSTTRTDAIAVEVAAVADVPVLTVPATISMDENINSAAFTISSALVDTDGSETLTLEVNDIPVGATLTDGTNTFTAAVGDTTVDVTNWTLSNLAISPLADSDVDFVLSVTATATEAENGHQAVRTDNIAVEVIAVADQPTLTVPATVAIIEDTDSAIFSISSSLTDTDGSETLQLIISDVPDGATVLDGTNSFTGSTSSNSVDVTSWALNNLTISPATNSDADFVLSVTATAIEGENSDQNVNSDTISVEVTAIADQPTLTVPSNITVAEDTSSAAFTIASALTDTDSSETLQLEISNVPVGATVTDGLNTFTASAGNTTIEVTNWTLTNLAVTPPAHSDVDFELTVTATATEAVGGDQNANVQTIDVEVQAVADTPTLSVPAAVTVDEDTNSATFTIDSSLVDTDGSETLTVEISDVPVGATLNDGSHVFTATAGNTTVDVTSWTLNNLAITPPADSDVDFELTVTATATEGENNDQSARVDTIDVEVVAVADQPLLTVPATITVTEDTQSAVFAISSSLTDTDGSETLKLHINDVPVGVTLSDGSHTFTATTGNTTVNVTTWTLTNLQITPPTNSDVDFTLDVTATATEAAGGQSIRSEAIDVEITAVADQPTLTVPATVTVDEDTNSAAFAINSSLTDTDTSESLTLEISGLPLGTFLTDGGSNSFTSGVGNMTVDVTDWTLANLSVTPPANSDQDFVLTVTATATEGANNDDSVRSDTISVEVNAVADQPALTVPATVTVDEDTSAAFSISSALTDTDGSETLSLDVANVPVGATLTDGINTFTATSTNTTVDVTAWSLDNLSVTPPANSDVDFVLTVTATATEGANDHQTSRIDTISVEVTAVADQPTLIVPATVTVNEDGQSAAFTITSALTDMDGTETLALEVAGVPVGATLTDGSNTFTGTALNSTVDVTNWTLTNLTVAPPLNSDVDFTLSVTATATEADGGDQSSRTDTIDVEITAVADQPTLTVPATVIVDEDTQSAAFTISSSLIDTDGSETLRVEISAVPLGATLTDGANSFIATTGATSVDVTTWTLTNLTITPPTDSDVDFDLTVTATATETANGNASARTDEINVEVAAVADQPQLTVPATVTVDEDTNSASFTIASALTDLDTSETLLLEISGVPAGVTLTDGSNTFTGSASNTTVDVTSWSLTNLSVTPSTNSDTDFELTVTATATEIANNDTSTRLDTIDVEVRAVADQPTMTVPATVAVNEDTNSAAFTISSALTDTDTSETLSLEIGDVPVGATLTDGTNTFIATTGNTSVAVTDWTLTNLSVTPPADSDVDFELRVTATATEGENNDQSSRTNTIDVEVTAVADQPTLTVPATITVDEDTSSAEFTITSSLTDADGSETLSLEVSDVPIGATLTDGTNTFTASTLSTTVDVTSWALNRLSVQAPLDSDVDFTLTVTAAATEQANGVVSTRSDVIDVEVTAVADQPTLTVPATVTVDEDTSSAAFTISSAITDTDPSETLTLEVSDVPVGATLTDGTNTFTGSTGNTTVNVTNWTLTNLSVTPALNSDVDFVLSVTATAEEAANGDTNSQTDTIDVEITAVADQPTLTVPATIAVDEDTQSAAFTISSSLTDTDGSETLTLEINDVPVGATLTDGSSTFTATAGNTTVDVSDWSLSNLSVTAAEDSDVDFTLKVTATATEDANGDESSRSDTIDVEVTAVADQPNLTVPSTITVDEDTNSAGFSVNSSLNDTDGSETLAVVLSDVPVGVTLTDGTNVFTATTGATTVDVTGWTWNNLSVTPPTNSDVDFSLTVTATATEAANDDASSRVDTIDFEVVAVADQPTLTVPATITVDEDTQSAAFTIESALTDADSSETRTLEVSDVPVGATLTDGTNTFTATSTNRVVDVTDWALINLTVTPPINSDVDFELTVTATATEVENGDQSSRTDTIDVEVTAVADLPTLTVPATVAMDEDTQSAEFAIDSQLTDADGSESLVVTISDIPIGATLDDGRDSFIASTGNTTVDVSDWRLDRLTITAPADSDQDFTLTVSATATEATNDDAITAIDTIDVEVTAVADTPNLTVPATVSFDEDATSTAFEISSSLTDTDSSEVLTLTVSNIPEGVTLTDGTNTFVGGPGVDTVDVTNWSLSELTLAAPADSDVDFSLQVTATAIELANGDASTSTGTISVEVNAVADEPTLVVPATIRTDSILGSPEFTITAELSDTDGSEVLEIVVGDLPAGTVISDGANSFTATARNNDVDIAGWSLSTLTVTAPVEVTADFVLTITTTATEQENGNSFSSADTILVEVEAVADEPKLTVPRTIRVDEDLQSAPFKISADLVDTDGSEFLTLTVSDVPDGAVLSDGANTFTATAGTTSVDITSWNLTQLTITAPPNSDVNFDLSVTASATETMNADTAVRTDSIDVRVEAVADQPTLTVPATVTVAEDDLSDPFTISSTLTDTDGSESLGIKISGVPKGVTISDGTNSFTSGRLSGKVDVTDWDLTQLTITPADDSSNDFTLTVTSTATENDNNDRATREDFILVDVMPVADQPTLTVPSTVTVDEDTRSAIFKIKAESWDSQGNESVVVVISDVPIGAALTDGRNEFVGSDGNTSVDVTDWNLGRLRITPPADSDVDFTLSVSVTAVEETNGDVATLGKSFDVLVTAVADQPVLTAPSELNLLEDETVALGISTNLQDIDGSETLAVTISGVPIGATLSDGTNSITATDGSPMDVTTWDLSSLELTPADHSDQDFELVVAVTSTEAANLDQELVTQTIQGRVTAVADQPSLTVPAVVNVDEDTQSAVFDVSGALVDTDGSESIDISIAGVPVGVTVTDGTNSFTATALSSTVDISNWDVTNLAVTPPANSDVNFDLTINVATEEQAGGSKSLASENISVVVNAVADLPTLDAPVTVTVDENATSDPFAVSSLLTDLDGSESLLISLTDIPVGATVSDGSNSFTGVIGGDRVDVTGWDLSSLTVAPTAGSEGDFTLTIVSESTEAANLDLATGTQAIQVTVQRVNEIPLALDDAYVLNEDESLVVTDGVLLNDFDGDGDSLTAELITGPSHGSVVLQADGTFTYSPNPDFNGTDSFTYQASDGNDVSAIATVHLTIMPIEDDPIANNDLYTVNEDGLLSMSGGGVLDNDIDPDGDVLAATLLTSPTHGALDFHADGTFSYRPDANYHGNDSFTYLANDGTHDSNIATVNITVVSVNDAPAVNDFSFEVDEDTQLGVGEGALLAGSADLEDDELGALMVEGAKHGQVVVNSDGSFRYIPNRNFSGTDTFTYKATDGGDDSNVATVQVTVNPVNDSPQGGDNTYVSIEDQVLEVMDQGVLSDDFDSDGDSLKAMLVTGPTRGELQLNDDGTFLYAPVGGYIGIDTFTYVANDGISESEVLTVTIQVLPQFLPPTIETPTTDSSETLTDVDPVTVSDSPITPTTDETFAPDEPEIRQRGETSFIEAINGAGEVEYDEIDIGERGLIDWTVEPRRLRLEPEVDNSIDGLANSEENGLLWESLDQLAEHTREQSATRMLIVGSALVLSALGSIAYTIWTVWCGFLTTSILSLMPGWKLLDPLPVLEKDGELPPIHGDDDEEDDDDDNNDESLASLVESSNTNEEQR